MTVQASGIHIHQSYLMSKACQSCFPPALSDNQVETSMRRDWFPPYHWKSANLPRPLLVTIRRPCGCRDLCPQPPTPLCWLSHSWPASYGFLLPHLQTEYSLSVIAARSLSRYISMAKHRDCSRWTVLWIKPSKIAGVVWFTRMQMVETRMGLGRQRPDFMAKWLSLFIFLLPFLTIDRDELLLYHQGCKTVQYWCQHYP